MIFSEAVAQRCFVDVCSEKFRKIHRKTPVPGSFLIKLLKKEALTQVLSCEFCEISKNVFFTEHLWATASVFSCDSRGTMMRRYFSYLDQVSTI